MFSLLNFLFKDPRVERVEDNIKRIHKNRVEPELDILMLTYRYTRSPDTLKQIIAIAKEHGFDHHVYMGLTLTLDESNKHVIID
jgi:cytosine/adenosine deaminase-related metal-dependent hydrolase